MPAPENPPNPQSSRLAAYALLVVAMASWGSSWAPARAVHAEVTPFALVFWRWAGAVVILLPFAARHARADLAEARKSWRWIVFFGMVGAAAYPMLGYMGLRHTTAINASLLNASLPLFIIPMAWIARRHTVGRRQLVGLAMSLAGSLAIVSAGAVALWALYTVMLDRRPPMHPLSFTLFCIIVAVLCSTPFYAWDIITDGTFPVTLRTVSAIGYIALFPSVVAYLCWSHAVPVVGPNVAAFFNPLNPVFGALAAVLVLGERIHGYHVLGFVLVLAGLVLTARR